MSDPLSIAASIAGVVTAGFQVAQGLYHIADGIGSAGVEVRIYAKEISAFSKVLQLIRTKVLRPTGVTVDEIVLVKDITTICEDVLAPLTRIQETLKPLLERHRESKRKLEQFGKRIRWYFSQKQKLLFYREALRGHQQNLDSVLAAMNYEATRDIADQMALRNTLLEGLALMSGFQGGNVREEVGFNVQPTGLLLPPPSSVNEVGVDDEDSPPDQPTENSADIPSPLETVHSASGVDSPNLDLGTTSDYLTERELQEIDDAVNIDLDPDQGTSALVLWEDIRVVSRKTKKFAENILHSTEEVKTEEAKPAPDTAKIDRPAAESLKNMRSATPHMREEAAESTPTDQDSRATTSRITTISADPKPVTIPENWPTEATNLKTSDSGVASTFNNQEQQLVVLRTPRGDVYNVPFEEVRTFDGLVSVILSAYFGLNAKKPNYWENEDGHYLFAAVEEQKFDVRDPQGQKILPQFWEKLVRPGWKISFAFWDANLMKREEKLREAAEKDSPVLGFEGPSKPKSKSIFEKLRWKNLTR